MTKNVIVLASGETERRALPHLVLHLQNRGVFVMEVRIPPRNGALGVQIVEKIIRDVWYGPRSTPLDKFVILLDVDRKLPDRVLEPFRILSERLGGELGVAIRCAYAQWHLESWYFADAANLRGYFGRALGSIDTTKPDEIQNPKLHLKHLLDDRIYTARVSEEIARQLDASIIAGRSPSFKGFLDAVMNGPGHRDG